MTTIIIIGLIILSLMFLNFRQPRMQAPEPEQWMYKTIQNSINDYFGKHMCRQVTVSPIGFIFESDEPNNGSFMVVAKVKIEGDKNEFSVLVQDMSDKSTQLASDTIINKIKEHMANLQLTGC